jgi:hypothetical protein
VKSSKSLIISGVVTSNDNDNTNNTCLRSSFFDNNSSELSLCFSDYSGITNNTSGFISTTTTTENICDRQLFVDMYESVFDSFPNQNNNKTDNMTTNCSSLLNKSSTFNR